MADTSHIRVGVGVLILKQGKILLGKRKNAHGDGEYAPPGGHFEYMESFEACVKREVREETGMEIENVKLLCVSNLKRYAPKHYVNLGFTADWKSGESQVLEPEKCEAWEWFDIQMIPEPCFSTLPQYIEAYTTGRVLFDS